MGLVAEWHVVVAAPARGANRKTPTTKGLELVSVTRRTGGGQRHLRTTHQRMERFSGKCMGTVDIIPDIHGQIAKLRGALDALGWRRSGAGWIHPDPERTIVFLGDFIDADRKTGPSFTWCAT